MAATHATLASFRMDPSARSAQREGLRELVEGIRQFPGFESGVWTFEAETNESFVMLTYDSLEAAQQMASNIASNTEGQKAHGVEFVSVRVLEVDASASPPTLPRGQVERCARLDDDLDDL